MARHAMATPPTAPFIARTHPRRRPAMRGAGLPDALLGCAVLGLGVLAWLRLPAITAAQGFAAARQQHAAQAAANAAEWLHALRSCGVDPLRGGAHRVLLPAAATTPPDCRRHDCTPEQMVEHGWHAWAAHAAEQLPGVRADLACRHAHDVALAPIDETAGTPDAVCTLRLYPPGDGEAAWQWNIRV